MRCVRTEPWVTAAETCELVIALDACGMRDRALEVFASVQHLRHQDGSYWTGWQFANQAPFPRERSSWTAAAVVLAADALVTLALATVVVFAVVEVLPGDPALVMLSLT